MKIRFLGTGTSKGIPEIKCTCPVCTSLSPFDKRLRSSIFIETKGKNILVDPGPDLRQQILREKITQIDAILITHEHYDHIAGLDDLRPFTGEQPIPIFALSRVLEVIRDKISYAFSEKKYPGVPQFSLYQVEKQPFIVEGIEIIPIKIYHYKLPILGYRIGNFAYLTDVKTIPDEEYVKLENLETLVINALQKKEHLSHQNLKEALENIRKIAPDRAYLTHLSHGMGLHNETQKELPLHVKIAYDGLTLTLEEKESN